MPDNKPDFDRLTHLPALYRMALEGKDSPFTRQLYKQMEPYEQAVKAGQLNADDYQKIAARTVLNGMREYMGGDIPEQQAANDYATQMRAKSMPAYGFKGSPEDATKLAAQKDDKVAGYFDEPYNIISQLQKMAGPETAPVERTLTPTAKEAPATAPMAQLALPTGPSAPGGSTAGGGGLPSLADDASDDERLSQSQLMMLYKLAGVANGQ